MLGTLLTHVVANRVRKPPFFFSRFNFDHMRKLGNTHYCFHCGGYYGFRPDEHGNATNTKPEGETHDSLKHHDPVTHKDAVIDGADQFDNPWDWLRTKIGSNFPYVVSIPSV